MQQDPDFLAIIKKYEDLSKEYLAQKKEETQNFIKTQQVEEKKIEKK